MKLKSSVIALAAVTLLVACHSNKQEKSSGFELSGTLTGGGEGISIYLDRLTPQGTNHVDSAVIGKDGKFAFHTSGIYKGFYNLRITNSDYATLILDSNEQVIVNGNSQFLGNTYTVSGSADSKLFADMNVFMKSIAMKQDSLKKLFDALVSTSGRDTAKMNAFSNSLEKPYDSLMNLERNYVMTFVKQHPASFACLAAIQQLPPDDYMSYYITVDSALRKTYPASEYVTMFHDNVETMQRVAIGAPAPDFTMPDTDGKDVSLSGFKGKVVLIDFWASWCGPCRASLPGIVRVYNKYKNKNFTILSVSLDKDKQDWLAAIKQFHLTWTNVSDLQYWNSKVVKLYNFDGIPFNVLVSADGKIVGKNLSENDLYTQIDSLLKS